MNIENTFIISVSLIVITAITCLSASSLITQHFELEMAKAGMEQRIEHNRKIWIRSSASILEIPTNQ